MKYAVLYNPLAGASGKEIALTKAKRLFFGKDAEYYDVTETDIPEFVKNLDKEISIVVLGGDGTLNKFVNALSVLPENDIYYYPAGSGNDFFREFGVNPVESGPIKINGYLTELPVARVCGKEFKFINNVGFGIDGYCCEEGDRLREENPGKTIDYTKIAIRGLLFGFKPVKAKITVNGNAHEYSNVWLAPTMNGKFYGGGMMPTPLQDRADAESKVSLMVLTCKSKLKTLMIFPSIFKGEHVKYDRQVKIFTGNEIKVEFDRPTALQIDGETIKNVTEYTVIKGKTVEK